MKCLILSLIFLSGCTTLNKRDCERANWYKLGLQDGEKGTYELALAGYTKTCSKYKVTPDEEQYNKGRKVGIEEFCTEQKGFHVGVTRRDYPNVCPPEFKPNFDKGFKQGLEQAKTNSQRRRKKKG